MSNTSGLNLSKAFVGIWSDTGLDSVRRKLVRSVKLIALSGLTLKACILVNKLFKKSICHLKILFLNPTNTAVSRFLFYFAKERGMLSEHLDEITYYNHQGAV